MSINSRIVALGLITLGTIGNCKRSLFSEQVSLSLQFSVKEVFPRYSKGVSLVTKSHDPRSNFRRKAPRKKPRPLTNSE